MDAKTKILILAMVCVSVMAALWYFIATTDPDDDELPRIESDRKAVDTRITAEEEEVVEETAPAAVDLEAADRPEEGDPLETIAPSDPVLTFKVTDKETGAPVTSYSFSLSHYASPQRQYKSVFQEIVRNKKGECSCPLTCDGIFHVIIQSSRYVLCNHAMPELKRSEGPRHFDIALDPGLAVSGVVVEDGSGEQVEGALIVEKYQSRVGVDLFTKNPEKGIHAWTDEKGAFTLSGLSRETYGRTWSSFILGALHPDYAEEVVEYKLDEPEDLLFRLKRGYCVYGRVLGDEDALPVEGATVSVESVLAPIRRTVLTQEDGTYHSAPTHSGELTVTASGRKDSGFSTEIKKAVMENSDLEVNFGTSSEAFVNWKGRVLDRNGDPMESPRVEVRCKYTFSTDKTQNNFFSLNTQTDGSFERRKLLPGRYEIEVWYPQFGGRPIPWGELEFNKPGLWERDISLVGKGATVRGVVVIESGAGWGSRESLRVWTGNLHDHFETPVNLEDHSFCFNYLPAGTYYFACGQCDSVMGVELKDGDEKELQLVWRPKGTCRVFLEGFSEEDLKKLQVAVHPVNVASEKAFTRSDTPRQNSLEWPLDEGTYSLTVGKKGEGAVERPFQIIPNTVTDIYVHANDLAVLQPLTVRGCLKNAEGEVVSGAHLGFSSDRHIYPTRHKKACVTDQDGAFVLNDMLPGRWSIQCQFPLVKGTWMGNCITYLYGISIPIDVDDSFFLDLVLPSGTIKGRIVDSVTSLPLEKAMNPWRVWLGSVEGMRWMGEVTGIGSLFQLDYVAPGEYTLIVNVPGYSPYTVKSFSIAEGRVKDMGDLPVSPCGILQLEAVSSTGEPIWFFATCNGERMGGHSGNERDLGNGKKLFTQLPTGKVIIEVSSNNYQSRKYSIELLPAQTVTLRAELTPVK